MSRLFLCYALWRGLVEEGLSVRWAWVGTLLLLLLVVSPLAGQRIDPDWCMTCKDVPQHFGGGMIVSAATQLVFPRQRAWQRLFVVGAVALAFEAGQMDARGSLGIKDWCVGMAGALLVELVW